MEENSLLLDVSYVTPITCSYQVSLASIVKFSIFLPVFEWFPSHFGLVSGHKILDLGLIFGMPEILYSWN